MEVCILLVGLIAVALGSPAKVRDPMINEGLIEGDLIVPYEFINGVPDASLLWPNGVVPYKIAPRLRGIQSLILSAMAHLEDSACVHFVERTNERDYVWINYGDGCYSYWGRKRGKQSLSLGADCDNFAIVLHEIMHALGIEHEHNRSDRDDYIIINWENIDESDWENFKKLEPEQNLLLTEFDFSSVMLYGSRTFAKDYDSNRFSMVRRNGRPIQEIYRKSRLSRLDVEKLNILYDCHNK